MKTKIKASFTIEAVFVMPILLFTIVSIIYLSFYLHDYCRLQGVTDHVLHKATLNLKHEADIKTGRVNYDEINKGIFSKSLEGSDNKERDIETYLGQLLSKGFLASRVTDVQVSIRLQQVFIKVEGKFVSPIKGVQGIISSGKPMAIKVKATHHNPSDTVRMSEIILDTGSKIKGFDELKDKLGKLLP